MTGAPSTSPLIGAVCIIPALNAERTVGAVVASIRSVLPGVVVLGIDDGSTDGTRAVLARGCDHVIGFAENRGKGAALRSAFAFAASTWNLRPILTIDADGQHDTAFAPALLDALVRADVVIGTRQITGLSVPPHRRLANRISSAATRAITRCPISDSQSGYRALRPGVALAIAARGDRYEYETDFLVRASHMGYRIAEVAVPTIYGPPSHFREWSDALRVARVLWSHRAAAFR
ncbi:MAG: glycosyltransferase family 2 protein [Gemmatimonadaceae bacterium]